MAKINGFMALTLDNEGAVFSPVKGRGDAHILVTATPESVGGDILAHADEKGMIGKVCGGKVKASNLEKGLGRSMCRKCSEFKISDAYYAEIARVVDAWAAYNREESAEAAGTAPATDSAPVFVVDGEKRAAVADWKAANGESPEMARVREAEASRVKGDVSGDGGGSVFLTVDGKCAREVAGEGGSASLKPIHGRSKIAPVDGSVSANGDGAETGVCPQCHREVKLTASGFIGTHYPAKLEKSPGLTERAVADIQADAAERKIATEIGAEQNAAMEDGRTVTAHDVEAAAVGKGRAKRSGARRAAGVPAKPDDKPVSTGMPGASGDQRTEVTRGAALVQGRDMPPVQPNSGHASTWDGGIGAARPDRAVIEESKHGGRYGYFTEEEYSALSRTAQRAYWRNVKRFEGQAKAARAASVAKDVATGKAIPAGERRKLRKSAKVGGSVAGHTGQGHPGVGRGETAEESRAAV